MTTILSLLGAVVMLGVLVVVHELGHYLMARALGIRVDEFSVGFGKAVFQKERKGILYSLRLVPLGGYCMFHGEDEKNSSPDDYNVQPAWKRLLTLLAGPAMNFLLAFLAAVVLLMGWGDYAATIESVNPGSAAEAAGFQSGDVLLKIDGDTMAFDFAAINNISKAQGPVEVLVQRGEERVALQVTPEYNPETGKNAVGININYSHRRSFGFFESLAVSFEFMGYFVKMLINAFAGMIARPATITESVVGPVGTIAMVGQAVRYGWETILRMTLLISVNLGVFNLLPFPSLDGARILFTLIEIVFRRPVPRKIEGVIHAIGLMILFAFMIYVCFGDVFRLIGS